MPNLLSVPVASLLNMLNIGSPKADPVGGDSGTDNFSSLLNLGNSSDTNTQNDNDAAQQAPVVPTSFLAPQVSKPALAPARDDAPQYQSQDNTPEYAPAPARSYDNAPRSQQLAPAQQVQDTAAAPQTSKAATASKSTDDSEKSDDEKPVKKVKAALDDLSALLASILQQLNPQQAPTGDATTQVSVQTSVSATETVTVKTPGEIVKDEVGQNLQGSVQVNTADLSLTVVNGQPLLTGLDASVAKDAKGVLGQALQVTAQIKAQEMTLTPVEVGTGRVLGPSTTSINLGAANDQFFALTKELGDKIDKLSSLLQQLQGAQAGEQTAAATTAQTTTAATNPISDVLTKLTAAFDDLKTEIAKVTPGDKNAIAAAPLTAQEAAAAASAQPQTLNTDTAADLTSYVQVQAPGKDDKKDDNSPIKNIGKDAQEKPVSVSPLAAQLASAPAAKDSAPAAHYTSAAAQANDNQTVAAQASVQAPIPQPIAPAPVIVASAIASGITSSDNSSTDSDSGNQSGGNQSAAQPAPAIGSAQAQNASEAYKSDFASALEKARTPVADQVAFSIKTAAVNGNSRISIQLSPEDLGKLDVKIHIADGKTNVTITAENKDTLAMLQRDSQSLMRSLNDAGLKTDSGSLSFNLRGDGQQNGQQQQDFSRSQAAQTYQKIQPDTDDDQALNVISRSYVVNLADGLDIKI